jgi:hypothetical protein
MGQLEAWARELGDAADRIHKADAKATDPMGKPPLTEIAEDVMIAEDMLFRIKRAYAPPPPGVVGPEG